MTWSVTVLPVPVAPVINPWRFPMPGRIMMSVPAPVRATANGSAMASIIYPEAGMRFVTRSLVVILVLSGSVITGGTQAGNPMDRIREADLKADMFALAGDPFRGREAGTLDEMAASVWVAERAREIGLQPAGDNGTYFQFFPID